MKPSAEIVELRSYARLQCEACGAKAEAACNCGAPYVPAGKRAAAAIIINPEMSDRAIAAEIGVDHKTVGKARRATGESSPVEKRTGRDGKTRQVPLKAVSSLTPGKAWLLDKLRYVLKACKHLDKKDVLWTLNKVIKEVESKWA